MGDVRRHWVLTPFKDRFEMVADLGAALLADLPDQWGVVFIDDGSANRASESPVLASLFKDSRVEVLTHEVNRGPAAARNTGLTWLRSMAAETVLLLDSDCHPEPGMTAAHLALHEQNPNVACIGGAILGQGEGYWAALDRVMSWFTSLPGSEERTVSAPLHLPTTNMSLKMRCLPARREVFQERLRTGEDVAFVNEIRAGGATLLFSPQPTVRHWDRETFSEFFRHQYRWGLHTYAVRMGLSADSAVRRLGFALIFALALPAYAAYATWLNMRPVADVNTGDLIHLPAVFVVYLFKGIAVVHGALHANVALFPPEPGSSANSSMS